MLAPWPNPLADGLSIRRSRQEPASPATSSARLKETRVSPPPAHSADLSEERTFVNLTSSSAGGLVVFGVLLILVIAVSAAIVALLIVKAKDERTVRASSLAITELEILNARYRQSLVQYAPIRLRFEASTGSKAQFDRFDLNGFLMRSVLEREAWLANEIRFRELVGGYTTAYFDEYAHLGRARLGRSISGGFEQRKFQRIEVSLFKQGVLRAPEPSATITATVRYTSPKGQNSYARHVSWDYWQLRGGLQLALQQRANESSVVFRRQRERSLMTPKLRADILRRDGYRCRMCGASVRDGVVLHIDHILPISRDGQTTLDNLQTLCETCNLGKGNRFVG